jgi:hypothetical protein
MNETTNVRLPMAFRSRSDVGLLRIFFFVRSNGGASYLPRRRGSTEVRSGPGWSSEFRKSHKEVGCCSHSNRSNCS